MIGILDYGAGNLRSVQNTLAEIGAEYEVVRDGEGLGRATKVILPGVGHFGQMMRSLDRMNVREPLLNLIRSGTPFLGICLGLQALYESSPEDTDVRGLGLFPGKVERFANDARVPHMGWNTLSCVKPSKLLSRMGAEPYVYFAHSYYVPVTEATAATCHYTVPYTAVLEEKNIFAVQFHPEKSGPVGIEIVRAFLELS